MVIKLEMPVTCTGCDKCSTFIISGNELPGSVKGVTSVCRNVIRCEDVNCRKEGGGVPAERLPTLGSILERTTSAKGRSCSSFRLSAGTGGSANETEMKN